MINRRQLTGIVAAAISGIAAGIISPAQCQESRGKSQKSKKEKHACKDQNSCKGKGGCGS
jgi:uncharacterized membrane protein